MAGALRLAIGAGFPFSEDGGDFAALGEFRSGYWMSDSEEWVYSMAIVEGNLSAAKAYEVWKGREPIIADEVDPGRSHGFIHGTGTRQTERLHVGCYFPWKGERVKVTSFAADGSAVACSYHPGDKDGYHHEHKIKKRYRITRETVIEDRADRRERKKLHADLLKMKDAGVDIGPALDGIGAKSQKEYEVVPVKRIRECVERLKKSAS
ncbi:MAG TPA: hypothetical protein VNN25_19805 [Thermoanaerobaculia bacterium]|nr:hypothetical protein [Thermoanaerobaculia bacterium]